MSEEPSDLKPCPRCRSNQVAMDYRWDSLNLAKTYFVYCRSCGIYFNGNYSEDSTIAKWNHRPAEDKLKAEVGRLTQALESIAKNAEFWDDEDDSLAVIHRICRRALSDNPDTGKEGENES